MYYVHTHTVMQIDSSLGEFAAVKIFKKGIPKL